MFVCSPSLTRQRAAQQQLSSEPMTYQEKEALFSNINNLADDKFPYIVNIIQFFEQLKDVNPDAFEIDIETLKPVTLRELEAFVEVCSQETFYMEHQTKQYWEQQAKLERALRRQKILAYIAQIEGWTAAKEAFLNKLVVMDSTNSFDA